MAAHTPQNLSVSWRRAAGLLPATPRTPGDETQACAATRSSYAQLRSELLSDPRETDDDLATNNPLCANPDSGWARFFKNEELSRTVGLDLERLYPGDPFFSAAPVQQCLRRVLMVYALHHPRLAYRQGMHEVAAVLFSILYRDACGTRPVAELVVPPMSAPVDGRAGVCDERHLEHDCYALFAAIMGTPAEDAVKLDAMTHLVRGGGLWLCLYYQDAVPSPAGSPSRQAPVHNALSRIWATLEAVDAQLHEHLTQAGVQPQLFLLRWLRLLFGREFHTQDVVALWTVLLDHNGADLTEAMAVAMILFLRAQLLAAPDFAALLRRLQKFPPVEDVTVLAESARALLPALHAVAIKDQQARMASGGRGDDEAPPATPAPTKPATPMQAPRGMVTYTHVTAPPPAPAQQPSTAASSVSTGVFPVARFPTPPSMSSLVCEPVPSAVLRPAAAAAARVTRAVQDQMDADAQRLAHLAADLRSNALGATQGVHNALGHLQTDIHAALDTIKDTLAHRGTPGGGMASPPTSPTKVNSAAAVPTGTAAASPAVPPPKPAVVPRALHFMRGGSSASLLHEEDAVGTGTLSVSEPAPGGSETSVLLDAPIEALEVLLNRMRDRWGDPLSSAAADPAAAAADDAAVLARALAQLRAARARLVVTGE